MIDEMLHIKCLISRFSDDESFTGNNLYQNFKIMLQPFISKGTGGRLIFHPGYTPESSYGFIPNNH